MTRSNATQPILGAVMSELHRFHRCGTAGILRHTYDQEHAEAVRRVLASCEVVDVDDLLMLLRYPGDIRDVSQEIGLGEIRNTTTGEHWGLEVAATVAQAAAVVDGTRAAGHCSCQQT